MNWQKFANDIVPADTEWRRRAADRLREQTRPAGSLGRLEEVAERLVAIQRLDKPSVSRKRILIFAADHGVTAEGVSLYPREVTCAMVLNFIHEGATINSLARLAGAEVIVADLGVDGDLAGVPGLVQAKVGRGTRNFCEGPAMLAEELDQAMAAGFKLGETAAHDGIQLLGLGEMGIGNTTSASALIAALTRRKPETVTGRGTGLGEEALRHKIAVIERALELHAPVLTNPLSIMQCLGGFEIAGLCGAILAAAKARIAIVIDGWIVSAAALAAIRLNPAILDYLFFAHRSEEYGHRLLLEELEVRPLLDLGMRLGEGSGAALAMPIIEAAARIYCEVATFAEAGVANRHA